MNEIKILHCADMHLDSPFEGLASGKASLRRREQRELLRRLVELALSEKVDLMLLSGDLLDSDNTYYETGEELNQCLRGLSIPVFIAPGNHDYYSPKSPYARLKLPSNVYVFNKSEMEYLPLPQLGVRVYGAAFTEKRSGALLRGFTAEREEGTMNILCIHGEVGVKDSNYNPISIEDIENSGMDYIALGHIHKASGLLKAGETWYSWPGCPEGRGFDECGTRGFVVLTLDGTHCTGASFVPFAKRTLHDLTLDVTEVNDGLYAVEQALGSLVCDISRDDLVRVTLTGRDHGVLDLRYLSARLSERFFHAELRDDRTPACDLTPREGDQTLRAAFVRAVAASDMTEKEKAAILRCGLAALEGKEDDTFPREDFAQ